MDETSVNPDLSTFMRRAARDSRYTFGDPRRGRPQFAFWPFDRVQVHAALKNGTRSGHWRKRVRRGAVALAWWTAEDDTKWVRVIGRRDGPPAFDGLTDQSAPWRFVFPDVETFLHRVLLIHVPTVPPEFLAAIKANPDDALTYLILADYLDEHGRNGMPIRAALREV